MAKTTCTVTDCVKTARARGWCTKHYQRWQRTGDPEQCAWEKITDTAELLAKATRRDATGCLVWTRSTEDGYGQTTKGGRGVRAHVLAWELVHGPVPSGKMLDHTCHNRACCEVTHLRLVTNKQNVENAAGTRSDNKSGHRGVYWNTRLGKWVATIRHNGKSRHLGVFDDLQDAASAAKAARLLTFTHNDLDRSA